MFGTMILLNFLFIYISHCYKPFDYFKNKDSGIAKLKFKRYKNANPLIKFFLTIYDIFLVIFCVRLKTVKTTRGEEAYYLLKFLESIVFVSIILGIISCGLVPLDYFKNDFPFEFELLILKILSAGLADYSIANLKNLNIVEEPLTLIKLSHLGLCLIYAVVCSFLVLYWKKLSSYVIVTDVNDVFGHINLYTVEVIFF
jgi:uncharacterized membrane protein